MKPHYILTLAMLSGVALGAIAVQALHAQTKPPVYYVAEVDVTDLDGYLREYAPKAAASSKAFGGQTLAAGQEIAQIEGAPPKRRVVIVSGTAWNSFRPGAIRSSTWKTGRSATNTRRFVPLLSRACLRIRRNAASDLSG
jgi:hypothetical protein